MEKTVAKLFRDVARTHSERPALKSRKGDAFRDISYGELYARVREVGAGLLSLGVGPREKVGLIADNSPEWLVCDLACICIGSPDVPRGSNVTPQEVEYILGHSDAVAAFVENERELKKVDSLRPGLPGIRFLVVMDTDFTGPTPEGAFRLEEVAARGREILKKGDRSFEDALEGVGPEDLATIIYTSGTTGEPKGVMLTHRNLMQNINVLPGLLEMTEEDRFLSILPPWHVFERMVEYVALAAGASTAYTSIRTFAADMALVRPTFIGSVPRIWEGVYRKITAKIESEPAARKRIFHALVNISRVYVGAMKVLRGQDSLYPPVTSPARAATWARSLVTAILLFPLHSLARKKLAPVRARTGGDLRAAVSGGGALPPYIDEFFAAVGITLLEGYGLTETSPVLAVRTFRRQVLGTVGPPLPGTEIKIVDGEGRELPAGRKGVVKVRGAQVMKGYYRKPAETAAVIDEEGWFDTGDLGRMTVRGELSITGRAKETIVLLGGENVEPTPIEEALKESPLLVQVMVVGQDRKTLGALVVPDFAALRERGGLGESDPRALCAGEAARALVRDEIRRLVSTERGFKTFEKISCFELLAEEFTVGRELTATMKMKRNVIAETYGDLIERMYR